MVPRRVLAAAATWEESAQLAAVEAACGAQLLEEEGAEAYHFLHDVTREVIEAELGAARRLVLHRRIAEALEAQPGEPPVELLAYHYERSGVHEQAGDHAAAQHAHAGAEGYYRELVERLDGLGSSWPGRTPGRAGCPRSQPVRRRQQSTDRTAAPRCVGIPARGVVL